MRAARSLTALQQGRPTHYTEQRGVATEAAALMKAAQSIGAGCAAIGIGGAGAGIGVVWGSLAMAVAHNPKQYNDSFKIAMLGFALTEAMGLFSLSISFLILYGL
jgi:F-type H+-transporting ATPase subunit c